MAATLSASTSAPTRKLDFPVYNRRYKPTSDEYRLMMDEIPASVKESQRYLDEAAYLLPETALQKCEKMREKSYYEYVCQQMSRLDLFGHIHHLKGFVKPGKLTTRFEVSMGLMAVVMRHFQNQGTTLRIGYDEQEIMLVPYFDIIVMPDTDFEREMVAVITQYTFNAEKQLSYLKCLYKHLPPSISFLWNIRVAGPVTSHPEHPLQPTKPFLRIVRLGDRITENDFVFVDEVKIAVNRLKPSPRQKTAAKYKWPNHYFPIKYLDFALSLFGLSRDQFEFIIVTVDEKEPNNYCFTHGPNAENMLPAECCFFRFARDLNKLTLGKDDKAIEDMFENYTPLLGNGQILPYMVRYFNNGEQAKPNYKSVKEFMERRMRATKWHTRGTKPVKKQKTKAESLIQKGKLDVKMPVEAISKIPGDHKGFIVNLMVKQPQFALLLHEQGFCEPGKFCYADLFRSDRGGFKCETNEELMKKRIKFALLCDNTSNSTDRAKFLHSVSDEIVIFAQKKPNEKEEQKDGPESKKKKQEGVTEVDTGASTIANGDGVSEEAMMLDNGAPVKLDQYLERKIEWLEKVDETMLPYQEEENSETSSSNTSGVHPLGTETGNQGGADEEEEDETSTYDSMRVSLDGRAQYEKMIKTIEEEHTEVVDKLNKKLILSERKNDESREVVDRQRQIIKDYKVKIDTYERERKEVQIKLEGDIKRISAEKLKIEDSYQQLKTKKAMVDPGTIQLEHKKALEKVMSETQSYKALLKSKEKEIEDVNRALEEQKKENQKLQKENTVLVESIFTNQEVVSLKLKIKDLMSKLELSELDSSHKSEKVVSLVKQIQREEKNQSVLKSRLNKMDSIQFERDRILELKDILEEYAPPSVKAAVNRIEALQKLLNDSKYDEGNYNHAYRRLKAYEAVEDSSNHQSVRTAHFEFDAARAEKTVYESELVAAIEEIKINPSHYFLMENVFTNRRKKAIFSINTSKRMNELHEKMEKQMQEEMLIHSRPKHK